MLSRLGSLRILYFLASQEKNKINHFRFLFQLAVVPFDCWNCKLARCTVRSQQVLLFNPQTSDHQFCCGIIFGLDRPSPACFASVFPKMLVSVLPCPTLVGCLLWSWLVNPKRRFEQDIKIKDLLTFAVLEKKKFFAARLGLASTRAVLCFWCFLPCVFFI